MIVLPATPAGFKDAHRGETIYVLGSGKSMDYIDPAFFADKIVVGTNVVGRALGLGEYYTATDYHACAVDCLDVRPDLPVIVPETDWGAVLVTPYRDFAPDEPVYRFPTGPQRYDGFTVEEHWPTDPDALVMGPTSLHMAMHFAAYLGASTIVLAGADCGTLDGHINLAAYPQADSDDNPMHIWQRYLAAVADQLRRRGTAVHSLNPFVNFALEGHQYRSATANIN